MAVAEFPLPSVSGSNPAPLFFEAQTEEFKVNVVLYDDNGADFMLQAGGSGKLGWILKYDGLSLALMTIIHNHVVSAAYDPENGSGRSFNLRDRDTGVLYTNVRYAPGGYTRSHTKTWIWSIEIILEKRP